MKHAGTAGEVFLAFLRLGCTSFGGPIAHLGYLREDMVARRKWLDDRAYADIVALAQFLPGPASSQAGMAIGLARAGLPGAIAAWVGFTLPSAVLMVLFAWGVAEWGGSMGQGWLQGLKTVAVAIVAQAIWGMARNLCPDRERAALAAAAVIVVFALPGLWGQIGAIVGGAVAGALLLRGLAPPPATHLPIAIGRGTAIFCLALFAVLLVVPPLLADGKGGAVALFDAFYRAGSLVFGGGHVVLPLLQAELVGPGWIDRETFVAGYGAAQAVPGPLFTFAAYLGAAMSVPPAGLPGAAIALVAVFLPGALLIVGALPFWAALRTRTGVQSALAGVNAAVVGLLGAAFYDPVWTAGVHSAAAFALAVAAFVALEVWKAPPWAVVAAAAAVGAVIEL